MSAVLLVYIFSSGVFVELDKYNFESIEKCNEQIERSQQTGGNANTSMLCVFK